LPAYARERTPFHAVRLADIDPATASIDGVARPPHMVKQEAQDERDVIVTTPDIYATVI
jgi:hypothetical protein